MSSERFGVVMDRLPFDWNSIFRLLMMLYEGKIAEIEADRSKNDKLNWFFTSAVPIVASDWCPNKFRMTRPYEEHVTTSDEVMVLWLLKHYPERRMTKEEIKAMRSEGRRIENLTYRRLNASIHWFNIHARRLAAFKMEVLAGLDTEQKEARRKAIRDYINKQFDFGEGRTVRSLGYAAL